MESNSQPVKLIGITSKKDIHFNEWYREVLLKSEMIHYGKVSGCYILRQKSTCIWQCIQNDVDEYLKTIGVDNYYFPLFITADVLKRESSHIAGFTPEVAWVTKAGESNLHEPLAIRPTSETVIYDTISDWIRTHRDLPLKINQWCNVIRWEFKDAVPFIRSREFLWQEGHTCHSTKIDAELEIQQILNLYTHVYENLLAVPVIPGKKTELEKFAGAEYTTTIECVIPETGKGIQAATSHHLSQNFSKIFDITYENANGNCNYVYQNSWGLTTRSIGIMVMTHSDNRGLIIPPNVQNLKCVIVACGINSKTCDSDAIDIQNFCVKLVHYLSSNGISAKFDANDNHTVGYKFSYWEMHGVPLRIEVGPCDMQNGLIQLVRRDTGAKIKVKYSDNDFILIVTDMLQQIQTNLFANAKTRVYQSIAVVDNFADFITQLKARRVCLMPWCNTIECEREIISQCKSDDLHIKSLCIPYDNDLANKITNSTIYILNNESKCIYCRSLASCYALFGSSY